MLFESVPGLFLVLAPDLTILTASDAYTVATHTEREIITGRYLFDVFRDNPEDAGAGVVSNTASSLKYVLKNAVPHAMPVQRHGMLLPDGSFITKYWSPVNTPVLDENNEVIYIIHKVEDVSDFINLQMLRSANSGTKSPSNPGLLEMEAAIIKRARIIQQQNDELDRKVEERTAELKQINKNLAERTRELTDSLDRERELNEMKSRFVSIASHEFRTPLSTILSSSSLIKQYRETEQNENRIKHVDRIASNVKNLTCILDDFLSLEQLNSGKIDAPCICFDLKAFLGCLVEEMEEMVNKKNQHITYNYTGATDVEQPQKIIRNIVLNLISNASKYSGAGKEIALDAGIHKGNVSISIRDQGIGIPQEDQKKLFAEFFRATNVENIQGTGLGLTIVKKYVELIGGGISFISKENEGTTFTVSFPQNKK